MLFDVVVDVALMGDFGGIQNRHWPRWLLTLLMNIYDGMIFCHIRSHLLEKSVKMGWLIIHAWVTCFIYFDYIYS